MDSKIAVEVLATLIRLDEETGKLYWLPRDVGMFPHEGYGRRWNNLWAGKEALAFSDARGECHGCILYKKYKAHHVAFALFYGRWPTLHIDHADGDPSNNRPSNLREASVQQNMRNSVSRRGSSSQFKGVCWDKSAGKWVAHGRDDDKRQVHLGRFADEEDAARAYDAFAVSKYGEFARPNFPQGEIS